ncbi:serine/arginine repetitive matrix protein 2 isoform X6 [Galleria mellonella]|uniref:Serine/arginine repetitive matrix protein 2 isoform X6 n=1 Tax=Galleria mellonella TaxID=7137 RepID=A0ABM3MZN0_GALME|nr:serine/arginine repetitive matrix protein 2 isoform X6 [Galleria mellonella]
MGEGDMITSPVLIIANIAVHKGGATHVVRAAGRQDGGPLRVRSYEGPQRQGTRGDGCVAATLGRRRHTELRARPRRHRHVGQRLGRGPRGDVHLQAPAAAQRPEREPEQLRARRLAHPRPARQEPLRERGARLAGRRAGRGRGRRPARRGAPRLPGFLRALAVLRRRAGRAAHARRVRARAARRVVARVPARRVAAPRAALPPRAAAAPAPARAARPPRRRARRRRRVRGGRRRGRARRARAGAAAGAHAAGRERAADGARAGGAAQLRGGLGGGGGGGGGGGRRRRRRRARVRDAAAAAARAGRGAVPARAGAAAPHDARRHRRVLLVRRAAPPARRARRRRVQPPVGDARFHADVPPVEGGEAAAVDASERVPHLRHAALVEHRQRYTGPPRGADPDVLSDLLSTYYVSYGRPSPDNLLYTASKRVIKELLIKYVSVKLN